ncbi:sphingosine-1-phosphate lyase 1-like [Mizuhopecten yessoensis]|uniref:sphingosine-1-phosphate lyase 1-like n=1 Tax=Mizuhopecten yessoensis TaxID=6573 RepID=UPI000B45CAB8|nr:sphingosine-1-phosphate lyase 1-like [Mizuhopecten yessoensis]
MAKVLDVVTGQVTPYLDVVKDKINSLCAGLEPWQVVVYTCGGTLVFVTVKNILFNEEQTLKNRTKSSFFRYLKMIPIVKRKIAEEKNKMLSDMEASFHKSVDGYQKALPATGLKMEEVEKQLLLYKNLASPKNLSKNISSDSYCQTDLKSVPTYGLFAWSNPLHPDVFPDVRKMEAEVVRMCCTMFNGDEQTCGTMTSGGTESILLACLTYRNIARDNGVNFPEMIVPVTVHASFDKAASYFRMKITHIPLDKVTGKVDIKAMRRAINKNTCMLVGSAPGFPHGIIDDIEEIAALGKKYNIPVHVDSCLGGFLVPFMEKAGYPIPTVDFRLPGVTSISADTHKYGFAPKGSSVILYRNPDFRQKQFFVQPEWPGGIYATSTTGGSRAGAIIAACWATMMHIGLDGYVESTRKIIKTARYIAKGLREIEGMVVYGEPLMSVVGMGSDRFNIFRLADILTSRGYNLNALQYPDSLHLCCTLVHTKEGVADKFLSDVRNSVEEILQDPQDHAIGGMGAIYGMAQSIPDKKMVGELAGCYLEAMYSTNKE